MAPNLGKKHVNVRCTNANVRSNCWHFARRRRRPNLNVGKRRFTGSVNGSDMAQTMRINTIIMIKNKEDAYV